MVRVCSLEPEKLQPPVRALGLVGGRKFSRFFSCRLDSTDVEMLSPFTCVAHSGDADAKRSDSTDLLVWEYGTRGHTEQ